MNNVLYPPDLILTYAKAFKQLVVCWTEEPTHITHKKKEKKENTVISQEKKQSANIGLLLYLL